MRLLETVDVRERLELALELQRERLADAGAPAIQEDVESGVEKQQREYILRRQLDSIRKELGEDEASVVEEYRAKIAEAEMPENVLEQAEREPHGSSAWATRRPRRPSSATTSTGCSRSRGTRAPRSGSTRSTRARCWTPTTRASTTSSDRIVEYIAVAKLRKERGVEDDRRSGAILTLIGPPGTADVDRRVDRPRDRARVRPHVARHPRRGGDPRAPPDVHRRPSGSVSSARCATPGR